MKETATSHTRFFPSSPQVNKIKRRVAGILLTKLFSLSLIPLSPPATRPTPKKKLLSFRDKLICGMWELSVLASVMKKKELKIITQQINKIREISDNNFVVYLLNCFSIKKQKRAKVHEKSNTCRYFIAETSTKYNVEWKMKYNLVKRNIRLLPRFSVLYQHKSLRRKCNP